MLTVVQPNTRHSHLPRQLKMTKESDRGKYTSPEGSAKWEYIAATSCSFLLLSVGAVLGWSSPALSELMRPESPMTFTESDAMIITVTTSCGITIAPILSSVIADKLGRRNSLLLTGIPMMIGWGMIVVAKHAWVLAIARFIGGISVGLAFCLAPMYMGEIASVRLRGSFGTAIGTTINVGILAIIVTMPYLTIVPTSCVCLSILIISEAMLWFIPESPYFLVMIGKEEEAEGALEKLRGRSDVSEELGVIKKTISENSRANTALEGGGDARKSSRFIALKQLFLVRGNRRALYINCLVGVVHNFGGYTLLMIYSSLVVEALKSGVSVNIGTSVIAGLQLIFSLVTTFAINKIDRRTLIISSGAFGGVCYFAIGVYFYLMDHTDVDVTPYKLLSFFILVVYVIVMNIGFTPLVMVLLSETFSPEVKAVGTGLAAITTGLFSIAGAQLYLGLAITCGYGYSAPFIGCSLVSFIGTALISKLLPETRGKTLHEIQRNLNE